MSASEPVDAAFATPRDLRSKLRVWFDPDHVCVLTIGKTASSAIIHALLEAEVGAYQAHTLTRAPQEYLFVAGLPERPLQNAAFKVKTKVWLETTSRSSKRFVTTFRDPFSRNLSAFFEQAWKLGVDITDMETSELIALYEQRGPHDATRRWFADNMASTFGLDAADLDLVHSSSQVLTQGKRRFLFLKYEDQSVWESALSEYCGRAIKLERRNDSARKPYSDAMIRLKNEWRPSAEIVERTIERPVWDAIYSSEEKQVIRDRWQIPDSIDL